MECSINSRILYSSLTPRLFSLRHSPGMGLAALLLFCAVLLHKTASARQTLLVRKVQPPRTAFQMQQRSLTPSVNRISVPNRLLRRVSEHRTPVIGGNWKSNGTVESVAKLVDLLNTRKYPQDCSVEVVVAPPAVHLGYVKEGLTAPVKVSTQNVGAHTGYGAYTGEMSADMVKDFKIPWVITGHSERREGFKMQGETNELVAQKTRNAVDKGLEVIACIGEKLADRVSGRTNVVLSAQLMALSKALENARNWEKVVIAYEPVWAIGTGQTASPEVAQETHEMIREWIARNVGAATGRAVRILYGGSVKGSNVDALAAKPDIDGFLVGGAALGADFLTIIDGTAKAVQLMTAAHR